MIDAKQFQTEFRHFEEAAAPLFQGESERTQRLIETVRHHLRVTLDCTRGQVVQERHSLEDTLRAIGALPSAKSRASAVLLHAFRDTNLLNGSERIAIEILESGIADVLERLKYPGRKAQTFEKLSSLKGAYSQLTSGLLCFQQPGTTLQEIHNRRTELIRALSDKNVAWYLQQLGRDNVKAEVQTLLSQTNEVIECSDSVLGTHIAALDHSLQEFSERLAQNCPTILTESYANLIVSLQEALERFRLDFQHRLVAKVILVLEGKELTRKLYPLHEIGRPISVNMPVANLGPGIAKDVQAQVIVDPDIAVSGTDIAIGDLPPGPFDLSVQIMMIQPAPTLDLQVKLSWTTPASIVREATVTDVVLRAQRQDVAWDQLIHQEPYSTEVAEGDEFVGRQEKIASVARRLLTRPMRSTYITGQKRVGKTSLAKAVQAHVLKGHPTGLFKFSYIEWGSYARKDPDATVAALGNRISHELQAVLRPEDRIGELLDFQGTLAPLIDVAQHLRVKLPETRFVVMLDEFDEIHQEMYRIGPLAEVLFSNLRTLASQRNLAIVLIGGEKMPFVIAAQGDQLNKFVRESLDYFSGESEWAAYCQLVERPAEAVLTWRPDAIKAVFDLSFGHPYYTKLICGRVFQNAVSEHDSDVTVEEVVRAAKTVILDLDVNAFAHYWKDGIPGDKDEEEARSSLRAKYLAAAGRLLRLGRPITPEAVSSQRELFKLDPAEVFPLTREFTNRGILKEGREEYRFVVPLFGDWLRDYGVDRIVVDTLSEEISEELRKSTESARVSAAELSELVKSWSPYRGQEITAEKVRAWLDQVTDLREQRMLFKLLQNLRFVSEIEIRNKLKVAFSMLVPHLPVFIRQSRATSRTDLLVCYVDGQGKSGQYYASRFAEENGIAARCVCAADQFAQQLAQIEKTNGNPIVAVAIVDDIVATGDTLSKKVSEFISNHRSALQSRNAFVGVIALLGTATGEETVRRRMAKVAGIEAELRICEPLSSEHEAFAERNGIWDSEAEMHAAKALCIRLGASIYGNNPLGYGGLGLLVAFPNTCPNNSLPILHSPGKTEPRWTPLLPRPVN